MVERGCSVEEKNEKMSKTFDLLVIGAGSGGVASARTAGALGVKVALIEKDLLGGTCVNRGCIPKKIMWEASSLRDKIKEAHEYGFNLNSADVEFNYGVLMKKREEYLEKLRGIYKTLLEKSNVETITGVASFTGDKSNDMKEYAPTVTVNGKMKVKAKNVLISTGSYAYIPDDVEGAREYGLTSDGFFELENMPKSSLMVGSGYIAMEIAHVLKNLGCNEVSIAIRYDKPLRTFDTLIQDCVLEQYERDGLTFYKNTLVKKLVPVEPFYLDKKGRSHPSMINVHLHNKITKEDKVITVEKVFFGVGRYGNIQGLNLDKIGVETDSKGFIKVDKYQNTSVPHVYSVGDSCGEPMLAPVAISAGRKLIDRLYNNSDSYLDYENIPSVVFSGVPCASIGLSESMAIKKYSAEKIKVYNTKVISSQTLDHTFLNLY